MASTVFFIGLGNMGWGMSKNIIAKANLDGPLLVYNRSKDRSEAFVKDVADESKVAVVDNIAAGVAKADIIWLMLSNDKVVETVFDEILSTTADSDLQGKLFIQSATIHPDAAGPLAAKVEAHGAQFLAAPVFGAPAMADSGMLIVVAAGKSDVIDRARVLFKGVTARDEILLRDQPEANSQLLKVIGNTFIFNMIEQLAEGHVLAEKTGLAPEAMHKFVELMFPGPYAAYSQRMLSGQYYTMERPLFGVDLARKDIGYALGLAQKHDIPLQNAQTADAHLVQVKEHDGETGDVAAIFGAVRQEAGLPYENQK